MGGSVTFTCSASNIPSQNFTWMREGETAKIVNNSGHSVVSVTGSSQLTIKNVAVSGYYVCDASVNVNQPCSDRGYLQVLCKLGLIF